MIESQRFQFNKDAEYILVMPYQDQWQWMFAIEISLAIRKMGSNVTIVSIQVPDMGLVKSKIKALFGYSTVNRIILHKLKKQGISLINISPKPIWGLTKIPLDDGGMLQKLDKHVRVVYPNIVENLQSTSIDTVTNKRLIKKHLKGAVYVENALKEIKVKEKDILLTVNGRYSRNKAVKDFMEDKYAKRVWVIESASHGKYEVVNNAQSMSEWQRIISDHWSMSSDPNKEFIARNYFVNKELEIENRNDEWTASMTRGKVPGIDFKKKICVFYSTTQIEFEGNGDLPAVNEFKSQGEAIALLRKKLPSEDWDLIVRRHPRKPGETAENDLILDLESLPGVVQIPGDSDVDSYALAAKADLVCHFGSSIGAELTHKNQVPVYSLGRTPWQYFDEEHHITTYEKLDGFNLETIQLADKASVLPWSYYILTGGNPFSNLNLRGEEGWSLDNNPIHVPFRAWLRNQFSKNKNKGSVKI